jgi:hypothetical protein
MEWVCPIHGIDPTCAAGLEKGTGERKPRGEEKEKEKG